MGNIRSVFSRLGLDVRIVPTSDDYLILLNALHPVLIWNIYHTIFQS